MAARDKDSVHMIGRGDKDRKRLRLKEYDYSLPGAYFVTICTEDRENLFGEIAGNEMRLNVVGQIADKCWYELPNHFGNIQLDQFVVMPNHVHGIIIILDDPVGATHASPLPGTHNGLGDIVGSFKSAITKRVNAINSTPGAPFWQRGYYDHIIRDDRSLTRIREYILRNPLRWALDNENLEYIGSDELVV